MSEWVSEWVRRIGTGCLRITKCKCRVSAVATQWLSALSPNITLSCRLEEQHWLCLSNVRSHRTDFREIWYWHFYGNLSSEVRFFLQTDKNIVYSLHEVLSTFRCSGDINSHETMVVHHSVFLYFLAMTCSSTIHTEYIVAFPLLTMVSRKRHNVTL